MRSDVGRSRARLGFLICVVARRPIEGGRCGEERGRYETQISNRLRKRLTIRLIDLTVLRFAILWAVLSGVMEFLRQFRCPKYIRDAL